MQIDFHHAVTYLCARMAGFVAAEAEIIAYSAQYVDNAILDGIIRFTSGARFSRLATAHEMLDLENMDYEDGLKVWQPFHFLAGNGDCDAGIDPAGKFIEKLICRSDSVVARHMVRAAFADHAKPYALHRLGIAMHVYADTWAHQGFAGIKHEVNDISEVEASGFGAGGRIRAKLLERAAPPVGHGQAGVLPDMPFLRWSYRNGLGQSIARDNTELFCDAADHMVKWMQRFRAGDPEGEAPGITDHRNAAAIRRLFTELTDEDGGIRHQAWLAAIAGGHTFIVDGQALAERPDYTPNGPGSWKWQALGRDSVLDVYEMQDGFATSNWKRFHDAAQVHRFTVLHDVLPAYGILVG